MMFSQIRSHSQVAVSALLALALVAGACASSSQGGSAQRELSAAELEAQNTKPLAGIDELERQELEMVFQNLFAVPADAGIRPELLEPKSVKDAQDVVRSDNIALFARAEKVFAEYLADHADDVPNLAWQAQLYLVWAESAALTAESLRRTGERLRAQQEIFRAQTGDADPAKADAAEAAVNEIDWLLEVGRTAAQNLDQVRDEKLAIGETRAVALMRKHRETYEGYRVAADLYRMKGDWEAYQRTMGQLEKLNPDSNGLVFLRGVVAYQKDKDLARARKEFAQAVDNDPEFTKARYFLALALIDANEAGKARDTLAEVLERSPGHPFANAMQAYSARTGKY